MKKVFYIHTQSDLHLHTTLVNSAQVNERDNGEVSKDKIALGVNALQKTDIFNVLSLTTAWDNYRMMKHIIDANAAFSVVE